MSKTVCRTLESKLQLGFNGLTMSLMRITNKILPAHTNPDI